MKVHLLLLISIYSYQKQLKSFFQNPYPNSARFFLISSSSSLDLLNFPASSPVSLCIFSSNGSPSSSTSSAPTYRPGVRICPCFLISSSLTAMQNPGTFSYFPPSPPQA